MTDTETRIYQFFATPYFCSWEGCNALHEEYEKEKANVKGCSSCQLSAIKRKYTQLILKALS